MKILLKVPLNTICGLQELHLIVGQVNACESMFYTWLQNEYTLECLKE